MRFISSTIFLVTSVIVGMSCWAFAENPSWVAINSPPHFMIQNFVVQSGHVYAVHRNTVDGNIHIDRWKPTSRQWTSCEDGLPDLSSANAKLAKTNHTIYLWVDYPNSEHNKKPVLFELSGADCHWGQLIPSTNVDLNDPPFTLYGNDEHLFLNTALETYQVLSNGGRWKLQKFPHMQELSIRSGREHSFYGLSGAVFVLDSRRHWKPLGTQWPNAAAADVIEIGNDLYASKGGCDGFSECQTLLKLAADGKGGWEHSDPKIPKECGAGSMEVHGNRIYAHVSCDSWLFSPRRDDRIYVIDPGKTRYINLGRPDFIFPFIQSITIDHHSLHVLSSRYDGYDEHTQLHYLPLKK